MIDFQFDQCEELVLDYLDERYWNLLNNFNPADVWVFMEMGLVIALTGPGKFAITSPLFTAAYPSMNAISATFIQIYYNFTTNKWWGGGNLFLISMQLFQFVQLASLLPLLWNTEVYLYDFRVWRFISFGAAGIFDWIYLAVSFDFLQLVFSKPLFKDQADPYDVFRAMVMGYVMYYFFPTFMVNGPLFLKELTLSQNAWSPEEDYPEGYMLGFGGMLNLDILYWFGIEEDSDWYYNWLQEWTR